MTGKAYALISEYALMCDMRLITREYGIMVYYGGTSITRAPPYTLYAVRDIFRRPHE